ncbi:hypothetical protein BW727_101540 [Jeotgalibaca dankookensis]|uniref:Uncharacterized protein n=1 Tax=Jeotgalibaca dankookensis TaxID=708126 RepID=A0A1S6IQS4_9LACT|nr:hypothetical protein [Jeotgalibaca dankookensis]AQS53907.1 hypothetical protein BW727_101540 [Jeotgalibaca dankookensis]
MDLINNEDIKEILKYILQNEKRIYKENPFPTAKDTSEKEREYYNKVDEISVKIAIREGIDYEN